MSTQFHFSNRVLLSRLQPIESALLQPYLSFVEEQVCIPWQRVCAAASQHMDNSPVVTAVKAMMLERQEIEDLTYRKLVSHFPTHRSRRGQLTRPEVAASSIRDINMFQAYLWLCMLEGNLSSVEQELLPLCIMVFPSIAVDWAMTEVGMAAIIDGVYERLDEQTTELAQPYMNGMYQLFVNARNTQFFLDVTRMR